MLQNYKDKLRYTINQEIQNSPNNGMGIVVRVYPEEYKCDILMVESSDASVANVTLGVPLPMIGGMSYAMPHNGDKVMVNYLNGDRNFPYIVAAFASSKMQIANNAYVEESSMNHLSDLR
jgi:hypothetical protein